MAQRLLKPPVLRYLHQLELAVKQRVGVVPEDVLSDAREFLAKDLQSLQQSEPGIDDEEIYQHFLATYGCPDDVAQHYQDASQPNMLKLGGIAPDWAPNWRICCTKCGRSAPAAKVGITRIGARSRGKYVIGWCRDCRWLRWLRLERDLDQTNLSRELGANLTSEQMRGQKHKPGTVVLVTLAVVLAAVLILPGLFKWGVNAVGAKQAIDATFAEMPENWVVENHTVVAAQQLQTFSNKLGGSIVLATNTVIRDDQRRLQINRLRCRTARDADRVQQSLQGMKRNSREVCRNGLDVYEFVCRTPAAARFAIEARYRLPIQPPQAKYQIQFDAIPVAGGDPMAWNKLFNLYLLWHTGEDRDEVQSRIAELSSRFQFRDELTLKKTGLGSTTTQWSFSPQPSAKSKANSGDATRYEFLKLPTRAGAPVVKVQGIVTSTTFGTTIAADSDATEALLQANEFWPADSPAIQNLSAQITGRVKTGQEKVAALLTWFSDQQNIRIAGETGSRYGTLKVLKQKHGHCWDYSDLFVTLCRASGIPARQVLGWLHRSEGHVWAEVLVDHQWQQFDPTTGVGCGSDYLPLVVSDDGRMPFVYASPVKIELLQAN